MVKRLLDKAAQRLSFYLRRRVADKYIIIESDDWGLERALDKDSLSFVAAKYGSEKFTRWTTDSLETPEDLDNLFNVLEKYKTKFERPPIITANFITHNVDYLSQEKLSFRPISEGFNPQSADVRTLYHQGRMTGYIFPQLHGYSHYNTFALRHYFCTPDAMENFNHKFLLAKTTIKENLRFLEGECSRANLDAAADMKASLAVFNHLFQMDSISFIPARYTLDFTCIPVLKQLGVKVLQAGNQLVRSNRQRYRTPVLRHRAGMLWSLRNARLDPHPHYQFDAEKCFGAIKNAFNNQLPAVIDFHRVNFAGQFYPAYAAVTLKELDVLFSKIHLHFPETQFITTPHLQTLLHGN